jgi:ATP-dependent DNA helicase RecQ
VFLPGQEDVVRAAVDGRDTLALMPTGSGKSLTYQLAAMLRPEPTLVLSPLIALMKDQVDKLPPLVAPTATFVNSSLTPEEAASRLASVRAGEKRLVYVAPERLRQARFLEALQSIAIGLVVVDEVHCVSMWGHDFRPDYLFIRKALAELGEPTLLGLTATATPETARDISDALGRRPEIVHTTVNRPNLRYDVQRVSNTDERLRVLVDRIRELAGGSAIVYARSRRSTEEIARVLASHGARAEHYHAGLEPAERSRVQDAFVSGTTQAVVATTAFGMGIDKPDVRLVCLVNHPSSLEEYVQMVGRAGRDGKPSDTLLLASQADAASLRRFAVADVPTASELRGVYRSLRDARSSVDPEQLARVAPERDVRVLVGMLEQAGLVERGLDEGRRMRVDVTAPPADAGRRVEALLARSRFVAEGRADAMIAFAEAERCRHEQIAVHFGEPFRPPCAACDVCDPRGGLTTAPADILTPLPEDVGAAILDAASGLTWPVGRKSLVAMLRGSVSAPKSTRTAPGFGILVAATDTDVRRWVGKLERAGALVETTTDGFRVLVVDQRVKPPRMRGKPGDGDVDADLFERLRAWRRERARSDGVPAYVVFPDATLREIAAVRPASVGELTAVKGVGPAKLERYAADVLDLVG